MKQEKPHVAVKVRRFREGDAEAVSALIAETLRTTNAKDYPAEYIEQTVAALSPKQIAARAERTHFYVACAGRTPVGCGAIGAYWDKEDESSLFTVFVLPEYQRKGIGRAIIRALEEDEYFLRARRIEIPASVTAAPFYRKMGYGFKNGVTTPDEEGLLRMEKFR